MLSPCRLRSLCNAPMMSPGKAGAGHLLVGFDARPHLTVSSALRFVFVRPRRSNEHE
jgi:hypothetical protein